MVTAQLPKEQGVEACTFRALGATSRLGHKRCIVLVKGHGIEREQDVLLNPCGEVAQWQLTRECLCRHSRPCGMRHRRLSPAALAATWRFRAHGLRRFGLREMLPRWTESVQPNAGVAPQTQDFCPLSAPRLQYRSVAIPAAKAHRSQRLFHRMHSLALDVLNQLRDHAIGIRQRNDAHRNIGEFGQLRSAESAGTGNDFVLVISDGADKQGLQDALRFEARGQFVQAVLVKAARGLVGDSCNCARGRLRYSLVTAAVFDMMILHFGLLVRGGHADRHTSPVRA